MSKKDLNISVYLFNHATNTYRAPNMPNKQWPDKILSPKKQTVWGSKANSIQKEIAVTLDFISTNLRFTVLQRSFFFYSWLTRCLKNGLAIWNYFKCFYKMFNLAYVKPRCVLIAEENIVVTWFNSIFTNEESSEESYSSSPSL